MACLVPAGDGAQSSSSQGRRRHEPYAAAVEMPEPLKESDSDDEPSPRDTARAQARRGLTINMHQSILGLIAAAGSRVDFNERFDDPSSDDDDDDDDAEDADDDADAAHRHHRPDPSRDLTQTAFLDPSAPRRGWEKKTHNHRLLKSLSTVSGLRGRPSRPSSSPRDIDDVQEDDPNEPTYPIPSVVLDGQDNCLAPVMSRMLQARADMSSRPSFDLDHASFDPSRSDGADNATPLAKRLKDMFGFEDYEQVIKEYPCWLLQCVLLQGFLYITSKHICFYAYLPKKDNVIVKSGYLSKSGKRNPKYNRYWFRLKGDVLSYYRDSNNLYFPHGQIDLRFGISAALVEGGKESLHFTVVTSHRTYNFKADSAPSAKEWVKSLQRVIFRSHNDGDSVKISLPIDNIIDVEETQMMEFSDTCKIRVIDNDETYAIDEYFFSFFSFGEEAINVLKTTIEDASSFGKQAAVKAASERQQGRANVDFPNSLLHEKRGDDPVRTARYSEPVRATLAPMPLTYGSSRTSCEGSSSRTSLETGRRCSSASRGRSRSRSFSAGRRPREKSPRNALESSESNLMLSTDDPSYSNLAPPNHDDPSASQILRGSDVFRSPTMRRSSSTSPPVNAEGGAPREEQQQQQKLQATEAADQADASQRPLTPSLQSLTKMGSYPLQRAGAFADYLNKTGKRVSSLFASESMGYVEKVSGMWKGGRKHYDEPTGLRPDEEDLEEDSEDKVQTSMERFRAHFALPESERLQATYFGYILRVLPLYGKIYISDRSFCFRSLLPGTRTKLILPLRDMETAHKEKGFRFGYSGLVVVIRGHEELFFEFSQAEVRDDCAVTLLQGLDTSRYLRESGLLRLEEREEREEQDLAEAERDALRSARQSEFPEHEVRLPQQTASLANAPTILSDDTDGSMICFKPQRSMRITCLTIGSRGDVQPYIALCKGLMAEGHQTRIATHGEFKGWIESHGIEFAHIDGDPAELMRLCIENGTFTLAFLRVANATFRGWLDQLLESAYTACQGSDLLIESPSAMAGIHIAEKMGIPYFRAFTMPWTRTRAYPHAFIMPDHKMGGAYNYLTYVMFDTVLWKTTSHQVNRWRNKTLGLPNTSLEKMQPNKVPFLYNFSPNVVAPPLDFSDWIRVTGYWFLDEGGDYEPPEDLARFIRQAREDGKKLVYVGFGSIIVGNPAKMTQEVIDAVRKADVRCVLSKGWSDRITTGARAEETAKVEGEPEMPAEIYVIKSAPHDWLFRQMDAAAHHGGSGTTGASLRAGIPTIIRPFFGDQYFFASRVEDLGVGVWVKKWGTNSFGRALWEATRNERMIVKARVLGEQIRMERGVERAIQNIYRDLEYATSLVKCKAGKNAEAEEDDDETEESWTFIGEDEPDPDMMTKRLSEGLVGDKSLGSQVLRGSG
ncbi:hypothetical protein L249_0618 [Ophiocordyceps polyrhachis-furcata BCC 54312]|uniref:Sterol 3-beta-glucosyltransferase n=1 Tax=Ophiocordyceps polyrhachis-furcata BCC 54312 TaxID=1330021 RepID=A0A367LFR4_9HYPO|nr:hypothetical protein L249_0618 [Ophiocordyceps polyrhachis-furcata BCC 54312]